MSKRNLSILFLLTLSIVTFFILPSLDHKTPVAVEPEIERDTITPLPHEPSVLYGMVIDSMVVIEDKIKRNHNISEILTAHNVSHQDIFKLANIS